MSIDKEILMNALDHLFMLESEWAWKKGIPHYQRELDDLGFIISDLGDLISRYE